jgi:hypothetical protein
MLKMARLNKSPKSKTKSRRLKKKPVELLPDRMPSNKSRTKVFQRYLLAKTHLKTKNP